jgi:hypothetical protein
MIFKDILAHAHSGIRWMVLILIIWSIVKALTRKDSFEKNDRLIYMFTMVSTHIQLLIGLILYFLSPKVQFHEGWMKTAFFRFYGMEHLLGMLLAIVFITIGHIRYKKKESPRAKHKTILIFYGIAFLLILLFIPWPFRATLNGSWF